MKLTEYYDVDNLADQLDVGSRELIIALGQIKGDIIEWNDENKGASDASGPELAFRFKTESRAEILKGLGQLHRHLLALYGLGSPPEPKKEGRQ